MSTACDMDAPLYHGYPKKDGQRKYHKCPASNAVHGRARGVRWNDELQCFEMRCDDCAQNRGPDRKGYGGAYWPLTTEFWSTTYGVQRCKACNLDRKRKQMARLRNKCTEAWEICRCGNRGGRYTKPEDPFEGFEIDRAVA